MVFGEERDLVHAARPLKMRWRTGVARNDAVSFLWGTDGRKDRWAIVRDGQILDEGPLAKSHLIHPGDRIIFPKGSIKSAAVGDILGITCVFMPSGFAVGIPPAVQTPGDTLGGTLGDFAYANQEGVARPFWLPKRRWQEMPRYIDEYGQWQKRLYAPVVRREHGEVLTDYVNPAVVGMVGVHEQLRSRQQELVALGVL